jgi:MerR family redox-sensitive transcriptional activator SoxR
MSEPELLPIGQIAKRSGVAASTLRFYEDQGLLRSVRSTGGHRLYRRADLRRIAFIRVAQQLGLSLEEIGASLASLPEARTPNANDWARLSARWRPHLDARIAALQALRDQLDSCIGCGCLSIGKCKLYNPQDHAGQQGAGPRFLIAWQKAT